jgi:hypothetical protein
LLLDKALDGFQQLLEDRRMLRRVERISGWHGGLLVFISH